MWSQFVAYITTDALFHILHYLKIDHLFCPQVDVYFLYFKYFYCFIKCVTVLSEIYWAKERLNNISFEIKISVLIRRFGILKRTVNLVG